MIPLCWTDYWFYVTEIEKLGNYTIVKNYESLYSIRDGSEVE